jgi:alanine racemase
MENSHIYSTWVEIDLAAIEGNVQAMLQISGCPRVMAVVKANAYGHGAVPVAQAALRGGASWLSVARFEEALELRAAGLECPILLLGFTPPAKVEAAVAKGISLTVWTSEQVEVYSAAASRLGEPARLHLKVDTGMSRLGVQPEEAATLARRLMNTPGVTFEGVFTHFARADEPGQPATRQQEEIFDRLIRELERIGLCPPLVHAANSAAGLTQRSAAFDMVRLGIALYGLRPSAHFPLPEGFRPALAWKTVLSHVKLLPSGRGVSYGHIYTTRSYERIGTLPVGYADGFRRTSGNRVLVGGRRAPVIGQVCMDQTMVQLDGVPAAEAGDEVVLIGRQGGEQISAEEVADGWGTINYEVVCGIGSRVPRVYLPLERSNV